MIYEMKIATNDSDNTQSRIIIEVNGKEIDILADAEGLVITLNDGGKIVNEISCDWE